MPQNERELDDWIRAYLEYTSSSEAPKLFRKWTAISSVAAALERKVWLDMGLETFYPNLYVILVGPSGSRKGTAMKPAKEIMQEVGVQLTAQSTTKEALAEELAHAQQVTDMEGAENVNEAMIAHSSVTIYNEELAVLFKHDDPDLIMWLTNWHDCEDTWNRTTKTQGDSEIIGVWVNLLGAMTPELVKAYLPETAIGGGLTGRIIFVYAHEKGKIVPLPFQSKEEQEMFDPLVRDLDRIHSLKGEFGYTEPFLDAWSEWVREQEQEQLFKDKNLKPYVNRRRSHALKLCMVLAASEGPKLVLTRAILGRCVEVLERVEESMASVFSGVGTSRDAKLLSEIAEHIIEEGEATRSEILRRFYKDIEGKRQFEEIINRLEEMKTIKRAQNPSSGKVKYKVNKQSDSVEQFQRDGRADESS